MSSISSNYTLPLSPSSPMTSRTECLNECQLSIGRVDVFYWPASSSNTDCLKSISSANDLDKRKPVEHNKRLATAVGNPPNGSINIYVNSEGFTLYYHITSSIIFRLTDHAALRPLFMLYSQLSRLSTPAYPSSDRTHLLPFLLHLANYPLAIFEGYQRRLLILQNLPVLQNL